MGTLVRALGVGFVPEAEPESNAGREALLRRYDPRLLVITEDAFGWVDAASDLTEDAVVLTVSRNAYRDLVPDPRWVGVWVGPDAGVQLPGVTSRLAAELRPLLVDVEVGLRVAELAERALCRGEQLAAAYRLGAGGLVGLVGPVSQVGRESLSPGEPAAAAARCRPRSAGSPRPVPDAGSASSRAGTDRTEA